MDAGHGVEVVVRCRPTNGEPSSVTVDGRGRAVSMTLTGSGSGVPGTSQQRERALRFPFDQVVVGGTQEEMYDACASRLVDGLLGGVNGTVFAYGQTGSGKTYTMTGPPRASFRERGLVPRVLEQVFKEVEARKAVDQGGADWDVRISYLEIYNEVRVCRCVCVCEEGERETERACEEWVVSARECKRECEEGCVCIVLSVCSRSVCT